MMAKKKAKKKTVKKAAPARGGINDSIKDAIKYPWAKMVRVFWFWLALAPMAVGYLLMFVSMFGMTRGMVGMPNFVLMGVGGAVVVLGLIFGGLPITGYLLDIMKAIASGRDKEMPAFGSYWQKYVPGFFYLLFSLILGVVMGIVMRIPVLGIILYIYVVLITPMLVMNYAVKRRFGAFFDIGLATKLVFGHFWAYVLMILKTIVVLLFWLVCSIPVITAIWTIPAMQVSSQFLIAQFYRRYK